MLSYRSKTEEARRLSAIQKHKQRLKVIPDKSCQYGPPDRVDNFVPTVTSRKRAAELCSSSHGQPPKRQALCIDNTVIECIPINILRSLEGEQE